MTELNLKMKSGESVSIRVTPRQKKDILDTFKYGWWYSFDPGIDVQLSNGSGFYFKFDSIESITIPTE